MRIKSCNTCKQLISCHSAKKNLETRGISSRAGSFIVICADLVHINEAVELVTLCVERSRADLTRLIDDDDVEQFAFAARVAPRADVGLLCDATSYGPPAHSTHH